MAFFLFILVNAALFIRPAEIVQSWQGLEIYFYLILACAVAALPDVGDDAGDDLEDHRGQAQAGEQAEDERRREGDGDDEEQRAECGVGHGLQSVSPAMRYC